jgi:glyoxylate utilization-related uncharacterized protein
MDEATMVQSEYGLVAETEGWFTVNVRDDDWFGSACVIEGGPVVFEHMGYTLAVLQPGRPNGMYHREDNQEDFLVLSGECILIVEGQERRLRQWDFVHCPPGADTTVSREAYAPFPPWRPGKNKGAWPL